MLGMQLGLGYVVTSAVSEYSTVSPNGSIRFSTIQVLYFMLLGKARLHEQTRFCMTLHTYIIRLTVAYVGKI